jgi:hypothetical protein
VRIENVEEVAGLHRDTIIVLRCIRKGGRVRGQAAYEIAPDERRGRRIGIAVEQPPETAGMRHVGRFSEGVEQLPQSAGKRHVGRFGEALERLPHTPGNQHVGRFSEGIEQLPETARKLHLGSFADRG